MELREARLSFSSGPRTCVQAVKSTQYIIGMNLTLCFNYEVKLYVEKVKRSFHNDLET